MNRKTSPLLVACAPLDEWWLDDGSGKPVAKWSSKAEAFLGLAVCGLEIDRTLVPTILDGHGIVYFHTKAVGM